MALGCWPDGAYVGAPERTRAAERSHSSSEQALANLGAAEICPVISATKERSSDQGVRSDRVPETPAVRWLTHLNVQPRASLLSYSASELAEAAHQTTGSIGYSEFRHKILLDLDGKSTVDQ